MKEIQQEYLLKTSPPVLFSRISSASGLAEWFADNVVVEGGKYTFYWGNVEQQAEIVKIIPNELIRFRWLDLGNIAEFEFCIVKDELTGDIALVISDNIDEEDEEDAKNLLGFPGLKTKTGNWILNGHWAKSFNQQLPTTEKGLTALGEMKWQ